MVLGVWLFAGLYFSFYKVGHNQCLVNEWMKRNQVSNVNYQRQREKSWVIQLLQSYFCPVIIFNTVFFLYVHNFFSSKNVFFIGVFYLWGGYFRTQEKCLWVRPTDWLYIVINKSSIVNVGNFSVKWVCLPQAFASRLSDYMAQFVLLIRLKHWVGLIFLGD